MVSYDENGLQEKLFSQVVAALMERGLILKKGTIVDSTIISAPSSTKNKEKQRAKFNIMFALANLILADRPCLAA